VLIARQHLRVAAGSEELATRLLKPVLEPMGLSYREGVGWLPPEASAAGHGGMRWVAAALDESDGIVLAWIDGTDVRRPVPPESVSLDGCVAVLLDPARDAAALRARLARRGLSPPAAVVSLRSAVRDVVRLARHADLAGICASLDVRWLEGDDAERIVTAIAACLAEAGARRPDIQKAADSSPVPRLPEGISVHELAALPQAPGVYRFYDAQGNLLYVGKSSNLRRRVGSYFSSAAKRSGRRFLEKVHRMEHELTGSEVEALLREARLIRRKSPSGNVQVEVHERGERYRPSRSWAILLPRHGGKGVTAMVVRGGVYLGHARIGSRRGGFARARDLLRQALTRSGRQESRASGADRDTEILTSWLARNGDSVSRLDLDSFGSAAEAAGALLGAARSLLAEPGNAVFRPARKTSGARNVTTGYARGERDVHSDRR